MWQTPENTEKEDAHVEEKEKQGRGKVRDREGWINGIKLKSRRSSWNTLIPCKRITHSCNIVNGQVAPHYVNVQNSNWWTTKQWLLSVSSTRLKNMEVMKKGVTVKGKAIYDMEVLFAWLLVVGQQRGIDLKDVFDHELSPVPPSLIDEYGCLRKGDKHCYIRKYLMAMLYVPIWS